MAANQTHTETTLHSPGTASPAPGLEAVLEQARQRLAALVAPATTVADAFARAQHRLCSLTDGAGILRDVSPSYVALLGYTREALIGQHFGMLVHEDHRQEIVMQHAHFIAGQPHVPPTWVLRKADGSPLRVFVDAVRIVDEAGKPYKMAVIVPVTPERLPDSTVQS
jgi:PAS domain S-box-containing protein